MASAKSRSHLAIKSMKTVIVIGATGGIGEAISRLFAKNGYYVGVHTHKKTDAAKRIAEEIGGEVLEFDLRDGKAVEVAIWNFIKKHGKIDVLVNSAGVAAPIKPIIDIADSEYDDVFDINVKGVYRSIKAVIPSMLNGGGSIVNVSSMWGIAGGSCEAVYSASKAAVIGLTKALAKEYSGANIRVNAVAPGLIDTSMNEVLSKEDKALAIGDIPLGRIGRPDEIAEAVYYLAEKATFSTGIVLNASGGEVI